MLRIAIAVAVALLLAAPAAADLIQYRTADGRIGFADSPQKVPPGAVVVSKRARSRPPQESDDEGSSRGLCEEFRALSWAQQKAFVRATIKDNPRIPDKREACLIDYAGLFAESFRANCEFMPDDRAWLTALEERLRSCDGMGR